MSGRQLHLVVDKVERFLVRSEEARPGSAAALREHMKRLRPLQCGHDALSLIVYAERGFTTLCSVCWHSAPRGQCPTCMMRGVEIDFAEIAICRRCGDVLVCDADEQLRALPEELLVMCAPDFDKIVAEARLRFCGGSALKA